MSFWGDRQFEAQPCQDNRMAREGGTSRLTGWFGPVIARRLRRRRPRPGDRWHLDEMAAELMELSYRRHRFPPVVIQDAVWLYLRFTLSYRDVEDLLAERRLDISYETVRSWVLKCVAGDHPSPRPSPRKRGRRSITRL